jgi:hypothetical protein
VTARTARLCIFAGALLMVLWAVSFGLFISGNQTNIADAEARIKSALALDAKRYEAHVVAGLIAARKGALKSGRESLGLPIEWRDSRKADLARGRLFA